MSSERYVGGLYISQTPPKQRALRIGSTFMKIAVRADATPDNMALPRSGAARTTVALEHEARAGVACRRSPGPAGN
jgi:hypothetical protein